MKIVLNGTPEESSSPTLDALLAEFGFSGHVATAVNETFVAATDRATHTLSDGDRVEVLAPMQGG